MNGGIELTNVSVIISVINNLMVLISLGWLSLINNLSLISQLHSSR